MENNFTTVMFSLEHREIFDKEVSSKLRQGYEFIDPKIIGGKSIQLCETDDFGTFLIAFFVKKIKD